MKKVTAAKCFLDINQTELEFLERKIWSIKNKCLPLPAITDMDNHRDSDRDEGRDSLFFLRLVPLTGKKL